MAKIETFFKMCVCSVWCFLLSHNTTFIDTNREGARMFMHVFFFHLALETFYTLTLVIRYMATGYWFVWYDRLFKIHKVMNRIYSSYISRKYYYIPIQRRYNAIIITFIITIHYNKCIIIVYAKWSMFENLLLYYSIIFIQASRAEL